MLLAGSEKTGLIKEFLRQPNMNLIGQPQLSLNAATR
jgi:hypothetical protein